MYRIIETAHHHGKSIIQHAQKHHRKYLLGVAGFFGIFKLFAFLLVSIYSYTVIGAALPTPITIAIPATTIDIQEGQNIIQFDLSQVEIGKYSDIQNIDLRMDIPTEAQTIYMDTLRNTITTSIGQPESTNMIHIPLSKDGEDMRTIHPEFLSGIIEQLLTGNTIAYFFPEENISITKNGIFMEMEVIQKTTSTEEQDETIGYETTGYEVTGYDATGYEEQITGITGINDLLTEIFGENLLQSGMMIETGEQIPQIDCEQYTTKKTCNTSLGCMRDKKAEQCILDDIVYIQEEYQIDIEDPTSMPTPSEIKIESKRVKQKINGYLQIHKDTHLSVKDSGAVLDLQAPTLITDERLKASKNKKGIPNYFTPIQTIEVGNPDMSVQAGSGQTFTISVEVVDTYISPGTVLHVFTSQDGENRESLFTTCIVDDNYMCTFETPHLTLFSLGTIMWNNMEFVNQDFRNTNPTDTQIIDAYFGTGGNPSAYTQYRNTGCRPTAVSYINGAGGVGLMSNRIYIINSSARTWGYSIGSCSAVISKGGVYLRASGSTVKIFSNAANNVIIDNLVLSGHTQSIIEFTETTNVTINDIQAKNSAYYDIDIYNGNRTFINNVQTWNANVGIYIRYSKDSIINNAISYNNNYGIYLYTCSGSTINNSLTFNNGGYGGIKAYNSTGLVINNVQTYNNASYGIHMTYARNARLNNVRSFNNSTYEIWSESSSGWYFGNNRIYPDTAFNGNAFLAGSATPSLGRSAGSLSTTNLGYSCDFVSIPTDGSSQWFYTNTGSAGCTNVGKLTRNVSPIGMKYLYGNNVLSGRDVLRQETPVMWSGSLMSGDISYYGHRFIGDYYGLSDLNIPVAFFTGTTPPQGTNVTTGAYSGYFTVRSYIYEPNLSFAQWQDPVYTNDTLTYPVYDSGLIFMMNFDNIREIGDTTTEIRDLSPYHHRGTINNATWTGDGKRSGAYYFPASISCIAFRVTTGSHPLNPDYISIFAWVNPPATAINKNIVSRINGAYRVRLNGSNNRLEWAYSTTAGGAGTPTISNLYAPSNQWSFVGFVYNGSQYTYYLNTGTGWQIQSVAAGTLSGPLAKQLLDFRIGCYNGSSTEGYFAGKIDEVRVYNRALSTGEIDFLYNSNLAARDDHREFVVNYTGVASRGNGTHVYGRSELDDDAGNSIIKTGSVIKDCTRTTRWNNSNYITGSFRTHSPAPTDCDIIAALYGTGTNGSDLTAYTNSWNSWTNQCSHQNMSVMYVNPGTDQIPAILDPNTIYVLASGNYLQTNTNGITISDCNSIVATTGTARIYKNVGGNIINGNSKHFLILDNIEIDGTNTAANGISMSSCDSSSFNDCRVHANESNGIYLDKSPYKKISNCMVNDNSSNGVFNNGATHYVTIQDSTIQNNQVYGIMQKASNYFVFSGLNIKDNGSDGIYIADTLTGEIINNDIHDNGAYGINNSAGANVTMKNSYIYNNANGIYIGSYTNNMLSGLQIYNNTNNGVVFEGASNNTIQDTQIYSNASNAGVYFSSSNDHIILNNVQIFNNKAGIDSSDAGNKNYISVNNSQIYNNSSEGMRIYRSTYFTINNTHVYNNGNNGIYFAGSNNNSGILNNVFTYNNFGYGIRSFSGNHYFYSKLTLFDNSAGAYYADLGSISAGNGSTYSSLGRTAGTPDISNCMNCSRISNTYNNSAIRLIDTTTYPKCNLRGNNASWNSGTGSLNYKYGINLTGQKQPVYRNSTTLSLSALGYSGSKYVAEINKIGTYNNTTCSCIGHSFRRENDVFLNSGFRNNNPNYCDIIAALYGENLDGSDETAYTYTRSGSSEPRSNQCNIENMNVTYLTGGTGKISMAAQTIYVLAGGTYIQTGTIGMNECTAIVGTGLWNSNTSLRSTAQIGSTIATQQFTVVDNISINGTGGGVVPAHTANSYGISIGSNSAINNASIYNNSVGMVGGPGISRSSTSNTSIHDNISHGIRLYNNSHYNTINNIQAYNNLNGIYIINTSNYTTINNAQTYNNASAGMSIRSLYTKINNSQSFNNELYGIELTSYGDYTSINNTRIYNNTTGLYIDPLAINGKYYGTNRIFANSVDDIGGSGENFFTGWISDYPFLGWSNGQILETGILGRDIITNPKNNSGEFLIPFTGYSFTGLIGKKTFNIIEPIIHSYGSGIHTQAQPVYHDGIPLITGGAFNGDRFIGSNTKKITGDLLLPIAISSSGITVTGISSSPLVTRYAVRGNIANIYSNMNLGTSTGIFLDNSVFGTKRIVTFLYKQPSTDGFLMHFEKQVEYNKCLSGRDNNNFIDETFRAMNPTDDNIICAIYGSEDDTDTAYTHTWLGYNDTTCLDAGMNVIYANNPNSTPLGGMAANTVYIFPSGDYDLPSQIELKICVTFISSGTTSIGNGGNNFYITAYDDNVIDNIHLNAESSSDIGIILGGAKGSTVHNMDIFRANDRGIRIKEGKFNLIDTLNIYNNTTYGIYFDNAGNNTINNTQTYNNSAYGMYIDSTSTYNSINNTAIYNNVGDGIAEFGDRTIVNNVNIFNQRGNGFYSEGSNMVIANIMTYNNGSYGFNYQGGGMLYYGDNFAFNNGDGQYNLASASHGIAIPAYGWTDGMLYDSDGNYSYIPNLISRDYIINPKNSKFGYTGAYLLTWGNSFEDIRGVFSFDETFTPIDYSYGSGILGQKLPIYRNDTPNMTTGLLFNSGRYIGSRTPIYTGTLTLPATTSITSITVTGIANASQISGYNLFGIDIANPYIMKPINTATSISLIGGDGIKTIITQLYHSGYFATHFQSTTTLNATIDCASRWNNDNFITGAFRAGNPTNENIICALYGTGPGDKTAYTYLRTGRNTTQCNGIQMNVLYTGKLSTSTLASNTIYVMTGGYSTGSDTIMVANCSAIISKNSTGTLFQSTTGLSNGSFSTVHGNKYIIFDNLTINATGGGLVPTHTQNAYGIHIFYGGNVTINNIRGLYANEGIRISTAEYNSINNTELYKNEKGIIINPGTNTFVNNTQMYNNNMAGRFLAGGYNTINNSQIYNNGNGITYSNSNYNIINNTQIYNNNANSISISGTGNIINNIRLYNDNLGIYIDAGAVNTKYYGINRFFNNSNNINGILITGSSSDYPGIFTNGSLNTTNTISRDYITNPLNANGSYLLSWTGTWAGAKGVKSFAEVLPIKYSYGSGIITQTQPVYFSGTALKTGGMFDTTKYIGSDTTKVTGYLAGMPTIISGTSRTISGNTSSSLINRYSVFGDITAYRIGQTKNTNTGIVLTAGDGTKKIITQFYSTTYFATHFETDVLLDTIAPTFTFNNNSTTEANPLSLTVTAATDTGSGLPASPYNFSYNNSVRSGRQASASFSLGIQNEPLSIGLRAKVRDVAGNESTAQLATGIRNNVAPTATAVAATGNEGSTINITGSATDPGNTTFTYVRYSNNSCTSFLYTGQVYSAPAQSEPITINYYYIAYDAQGLGSSCTTGTVTRNNIAPTITINNNGPTNENTPITRTATGVDTGATITYRRYSDYACTTFLSSGATNTVQATLTEPGTLPRSVKAYDGTTFSSCTGSTGTRNNVAPTANNLNYSTSESNNITFTANASDPGGTTSTGYAWYLGSSCAGLPLGSASTFVTGYNEPYVLTLSYKVSDAQGLTGNCAIATGTRTNTAPTASAISATGLESTNITITGSATDPGGSTLTYVRYSNATCTSFSYTGQGYTKMQNEPATVNYYYIAYDAQGLGSACTTGTATRTNTGPVNTSLTNNGPTGENSTITRTASAIDTGNTMVYVRYSGYSCNTLLGTGTSTTGYTMSDPGSLARSIRIYDTQGSGGVCIGSTGIRINTTLDCLGTRNNDNFISGAFWNLNPSDDNVICALYGSGIGDITAYTQFRSGRDTTQCSGVAMNVIYTGKLSLSTLDSNTIYVMTGTYSTGSDTIMVANCSAIISKNNTGTLFQSTTGLSNGSFSTVHGNKYIIFDNLTINGTGGGLVPAHTQNAYGIHIFYGGNVTINNIRCSYTNEGIRLSLSANYNSINNSEVYKNDKGVITNPGINTLINNTKIYNNNLAVWIIAGGYNTINNSQIYNNGNSIAYSNSNYNIINNTQIYNNHGGISISGTGNILHNIRSYNNDQGINIDPGAVNTKYYGINRFFDNSNDINGTLITGSSSEYPGIFTDGLLDTTDIISRDYITNPINNNGNYLLPWTGTWAGIKGTKSFDEILPIKYSYGSGIVTQIQPVYYSGTTLKTGGIYDTNNYIGSDIPKITGDLMGLDTIASLTVNITGISSSSWIQKYSMFGDIDNIILGTNINTATSIQISSGDGTKRIITQLSGNNYFATHFENDIEISAPIIYFTGSTPISGTTITGNNFKPQIEMIATGGIHSFIYTFNGINYSYYDSGLVLMMNFDKRSSLNETDALIKDFSRYGNNGSGYGGVTRTNNGRWDGAYEFNGSSRIVVTENESLGITGQLTYGARFKANTLSSQAGIMSRMRVRGSGYNLQVGTDQNIACGMGIYVQTSRVPQTGVRYHALCVYNGTTMKLYVNGQYQSEGSATLNVGPDPLTLGVFYTSNSLYFNGLIDEPRIRNRALSSGEIYQMRRSNFAKIEENKWLFTDDRQCVVDNTYIYTGYVKNLYGMSATTGRTNIVDILNPTPYAPVGYFIGSTGVAGTSRILSGQFTGHFKLEDREGTTGWYTTIMFPIVMSGTTYSANAINWDKISFRATGAETISGTSTTQVYVTGSLATPQSTSGAVKYIIRDFVEGYSCPAGVYGNKPYISVDIPARQSPDTYSGLVTIDINN